MKVLLTGFEPFDNADINPSWEAVKKIPEISGFELKKVLLPVVFRKASALLISEIEKFSPDAVICTGLAGNRDRITVERVAINIEDARIPDNDGNCPVDQLISSDGPDAYFTTLPMRKIISRMEEAGVKAAVSNSAGTYVCNDIMYSLLRYISLSGKDIKGGFIHLPDDLTESMPLALTEAVKALV
ncbi:MAG: pyroglutamyl-peptidase I [Clostridia bacterium]|nr:pyroglutamyl-peptidase I [Clostridia bacterium]